jgi:hypothetical protein
LPSAIKRLGISSQWRILCKPPFKSAAFLFTELAVQIGDEFRQLRII